jgi:hypothetical protein
MSGCGRTAQRKALDDFELHDFTAEIAEWMCTPQSAPPSASKALLAKVADEEKESQSSRP